MIIGLLITGFLGLVGIAGIVMAVVLSRRSHKPGPGKAPQNPTKSFVEMAQEETSHLFNTEFRDELRNHARLRLESIIDENAMFLQQDLRLTTSQLNEYMKQQITTRLNTEFDAYNKTLTDLQELAQTSLNQTVTEVEQQRVTFNKKLEEEVAKHRATMLKAYEENMAEVIEHYVLQALGDQFDLKTQMPYILKQMEANKKDIIEDMKL